MKHDDPVVAGVQHSPPALEGAASGFWGLDRRRAALLLGVLIATAIVYLPSLRDGFVFDDHGEIVENRRIGDWSFLWISLVRNLWWFRPGGGRHSAYYRPLQNIWFGVFFHLVGRGPGGWHAAKIAMHLVAVLLSFRLAQVLSGSFAVALITALLFGLHPAHAEAVVWISSIPEVLVAIFEFATLIVFIGRHSHPSARVLSISLFSLALLSHETAVVFPLVLMAYVAIFEHRSATDASAYQRAKGSVQEALRQVWLFSIPIFLLVLARAVILQGRFLGRAPERIVVGLVNHKTVVEHVSTKLSVPQVIATAPSAILGYLKLMAVPWVDGPVYPILFVTRPNFMNVGLPVMVLLGLVIAVSVLARRSSHGRLYVFSTVWAVTALIVPLASLNQILVTPVQDRYAYAAAFGLCLAFGVAAGFGTESSWRRISAIAVGVLALIYAFCLWRLQPIWTDDATLFAECAREFPDSAFYRRAYGAVLDKEGNLTGAVREFEAAERLDPADYHAHVQLAGLYGRLGRQADSKRELHEYYRLFAPWGFGESADSR
jgi:protein O-mannosyl-transferase